ncbi:MAG: ribosome biogenesis GTPase YlqF [Clostridia bacterium]|nr:ribosome biogenesis GTPase YlqF [Clostridia bacterium]
MSRARREIGDAIKQVDIVIELLDARIPMASRNPVLNEIIGNKPRLLVLNKADLANDKISEAWVKYFEDSGQPAVLVNSNTGKGVNDVTEKAVGIMASKLEKEMAKGKIGASIKAMIVGIPNVGKSTLINKIAGKQTMETSNRPGVTRKNQWVRLNDKIQLLDTPGILWPKFDNEVYARHLAYIGTIKDDVIDVEELALELVKELVKIDKDKLYERYKIADDFTYEMDYELLEEIGRKRGCLVKGQEVDFTRTANIVLNEFRCGKIGRISLEKAK